MKKNRIIALSILVIACVLIAMPVFCQGKHAGEQKMLDVDIQFTNSVGKTVADKDGVFYHFYGIVTKEDKIYPEKYWGEFPLYFFGMETGVIVRVINNGPRAKSKIRIVCESYVLNTDGTNGGAMMQPKIIEAEIAKGETTTIDASFVTEYTPALDSGLDRFIVKVLHVNEGTGSEKNPEPALIMSKEGIYCPPKFVPQK